MLQDEGDDDDDGGGVDRVGGRGLFSLENLQESS